MLKLKVWKWTLIVIWDTGKYHVRRNPQRRSSGVQEGRGVSTAAVQGPLSTLFIVNSRLQRELEGAAAQRKALASRVAQGKGQQQHQLLQLR